MLRMICCLSMMLFMIFLINQRVITPESYDGLPEIQDVRNRASIYLDVMSEIVQIIYSSSERYELVRNQN